MKKAFLAIVAGALLGAVAIQFYPLLTPPPPTTLTTSLADLVPAEIPGWKVTEIPIAETEEMKATVENALRYDDHVVRLYERGPLRFMVYVAHWAPGKMPYRMVGAHSPDTCWIQNGWEREDRAKWGACPDGSPFAQPVEYGTYTKQGLHEKVMFWHLVGGEVYAFEQHGLHNPLGVFHDFFEFGFSQRREQFFVRISSNTEFDRLWKEPAFQQVLAPIRALGVPTGTGPSV